MQSALRALLTGAPFPPLSQISWERLPQGAPMPALLLTQVDGGEGLHQQGRDGLWRGRVQIDVFAETYAKALSLRDALVGVLDLHQGGGFDSIFFDSERASGPEDGAIHRPSRITLDFLVNWRARP